jgi:FtsH-binding integral membrane protein
MSDNAARRPAVDQGRLSTVRISAAVALLLLAGYHALRFAAGGCSGAACDWYIPASLFVPLMVLAAVVTTGWLAVSAAIRTRERPGGGAWLWSLVVCSILGVAGPLLGLAVLRDSPDALVVTSTVLLALAPVAALLYGQFGPGRARARV